MRKITSIDYSITEKCYEKSQEQVNDQRHEQQRIEHIGDQRCEYDEQDVNNKDGGPGTKYLKPIVYRICSSALNRLWNL